MLSEFEKMVVLSSSTTNEWPVQNHIDEKGLMASTGRMIMEKQPSQDQQQQQQPPPPQQQLKCPRCDSANTKFCYYNNYSLSQPRHFCKACKRYWTRGGTLRNVPVGGGCRKNKRVKRPSSSSEAISSASTNPSHVHQHHVDLLSSSSNHVNPMFYGLPTNLSELNLPYQRLNSSVSGFDLQPQVNNVLGLGFSSRLMGSDISNESYRNGFNSTKPPIQDVVTSNPIFSSYPLHGSSSTSNTTSTLASLIASSFHQQKLVSSSSERFKEMQLGGNNFHGSIPFDNMHMAGNFNIQGGMMMKDMKRENVNNQNHHIEQINNSSSSDPSLWNPNGVGAWLDPSVPSLI